MLPLAAKVPTVKWKRLQGVRCTESDLHTWFAEHDWRPGIITGGLSGVVVVDCDDHATAAGIVRAGWGSPTQQATAVMLSRTMTRRRGRPTVSRRHQSTANRGCNGNDEKHARRAARGGGSAAREPGGGRGAG